MSDPLQRNAFDEIKSPIPEYLLADASDAERHMIGTVTVLEQRTNFLRKELETLEAATTDARNRLAEVERIVAMAKSGWSIALIVGSVLMGIFEAVKIAIGFFHK